MRQLSPMIWSPTGRAPPELARNGCPCGSSCPDPPRAPEGVRPKCSGPMVLHGAAHVPPKGFGAVESVPDPTNQFRPGEADHRERRCTSGSAWRSASCRTSRRTAVSSGSRGYLARDLLEEAHHSTAIEGNTLVLKQVEVLLAEGRAIGNKELREYLEVQGYANAADWVYGHGLQPGAWSDGQLISLAEIRHVHTLAMTPVWDVAPHPQTTEREGPSSFREHDIEPFPGGMRPPAWTDVPSSHARLGQRRSGPSQHR